MLEGSADCVRELGHVSRGDCGELCGGVLSSVERVKMQFELQGVSAFGV